MSKNNGKFKYVKTEKPREQAPPQTDNRGRKYENSQPSTAKVPTCSTDVLHAAPLLLDDNQVANFLVDGYLKINTGLPASFHKDIYDFGESQTFSRKDNPGNNVLPTIPALQYVFECPATRGALTSLLGEEYMMHPHRHPHMNPPGFKEQLWHRDSYWGHKAHRYHVPIWVMAMYYPQDTTVEMGPTAVAVGTQYFSVPDDTGKQGIKQSKMEPGWGAKEKSLTCEAGSVVFIHYDVWHKGTSNNSGVNRYMYKFQFVRMTPPDKPTWNSQSPEWPLKQTVELFALYKQMWKWMRGDSSSSIEQKTDTSKFHPFFSDVSYGAEPRRLMAAYNLAESNNGIEELFEILTTTTSGNMRRCVLYALSRTNSEKVAQRLADIMKKTSDAWIRSEFVFTLGSMGKIAVSTLGDILRESVPTHADRPSVTLCCNVAESIGLILFWSDSIAVCDPKQISECFQVLSELLKHHDNQVRFNVCLTIGRIAHVPAAQDLVPALESSALNDEDRYVRAYAIDAMSRMSFPGVFKIVLRVLQNARWCPITNSDSQF